MTKIESMAFHASGYRETRSFMYTIHSPTKIRGDHGEWQETITNLNWALVLALAPSRAIPGEEWSCENREMTLISGRMNFWTYSGDVLLKVCGAKSKINRLRRAAVLHSSKAELNSILLIPRKSSRQLFSLQFYTRCIQSWKRSGQGKTGSWNSLRTCYGHATDKLIRTLNMSARVNDPRT